MPELRSPGKLPDPRRLFLRGGFQFGDALGADLMDDAPQFLDALAQPCQLFLADLVVPGITGLSVGLFQLLEHRARSEEHTSELQSLMRISYAVFCLKKKH